MSAEDRLGKGENEKRKSMLESIWERGGGKGTSGESGFVGL